MIDQRARRIGRLHSFGRARAKGANRLECSIYSHQVTGGMQDIVLDRFLVQKQVGRAYLTAERVKTQMQRSLALESVSATGKLECIDFGIQQALSYCQQS